MARALWEIHGLQGLVVEPEARFEATITTLERLRAASTWGEVRSAPLAPWASAQLEQIEQDAFDPIGDDESWVYREAVEWLIEVVPLSTDARDTAVWLGDELLAEHARISGGSPGGHSDSYRVHDTDAFLAAVQAAGHELVHRPGFLDELIAAI